MSSCATIWKRYQRTRERANVRGSPSYSRHGNWSCWPIPAYWTCCWNISNPRKPAMSESRELSAASVQELQELESRLDSDDGFKWGVYSPLMDQLRTLLLL